MKHQVLNATLAAMVALLTACGGGGDSGPADPTVVATSGGSSPSSQPSAGTSAGSAGGSTGATASTGQTQVTPSTPSTTQNDLRARSWALPFMLGDRNAGVLRYNDSAGHDTAIADDGTATSVYAQRVGGGRYALRAVRAFPGAAGQVPRWEPPVELDTAAPIAHLLGAPQVVVSPSGHALVVWYSEDRCDSTTYNTLARTCNFVYASRRLANATDWEAAVRVKDSPLGSWGKAIPLINDRGETAILFPGDSAPAAQSLGAFSSTLNVALRSASEAAYRVENLPTIQLFGTLRMAEHLQAGLDNHGRITIAAERPNTAKTRDLVILTGSVQSGFGVQAQAEPLEAYDSMVDLFGLRVGTDGTVAVAFRQDTPQRKRATVMAVRAPGAGTWVMEDVTDTVGTLSTPDTLDFLEVPVMWSMTVPDNANGDVLIYRECSFVRRSGARWQAGQPIMDSCKWGQTASRGRFAMSRNGNFLFMDETGRWAAYDPRTARFDKSLMPNKRDSVAEDYVLGVPVDPTNVSDGNQLLIQDSSTAMAVTPSGIGVMVVRSTFSTMPSPAAPLGDAGKVDNLFGFFYR